MLVADQSIAEALKRGDFSICTKDLCNGLDFMKSKLVALKSLFVQANQLRLQTLQDFMGLLNPVQSAQCSISAFELVYSMKALGSALCKSG